MLQSQNTFITNSCDYKETQIKGTLYISHIGPHQHGIANKQAQLPTEDTNGESLMSVGCAFQKSLRCLSLPFSIPPEAYLVVAWQQESLIGGNMLTLAQSSPYPPPKCKKVPFAWWTCNNDQITLRRRWSSLPLPAAPHRHTENLCSQTAIWGVQRYTWT